MKTKTNAGEFQQNFNISQTKHNTGLASDKGFGHKAMQYDNCKNLDN